MTQMTIAERALSGIGLIVMLQTVFILFVSVWTGPRAILTWYCVGAFVVGWEVLQCLRQGVPNTKQKVDNPASIPVR